MINQVIRYTPVIDFIKEKEPRNICEIGSGSYGIGRFSDIFFTGVDTSFEDYGTSFGKKKNIKMEKVTGNACEIPIEDNSFDLVFSLDMIEHLNEDERIIALNEALRISKCWVIFGFPCGEEARKIDKIIVAIYNFFGSKTPIWLGEHLNKTYPTETLFRILLDRVCYNCTLVKTVKNENNLIHLFLILFEKIPFIGKISSSLSSIGLFKKIWFVNLVSKGSCYRKLYFINCKK